MNYDVVIVGCGPAGIFTALEMLRKGSKKKILMIGTGGTIACKQTSEGLLPAQSSEELLSAVELASEGFYTINGGDAVCCVSEKKRGQLIVSELIISPMLLELSGEIDTEVAQLLAKYFDAFEVSYNMPGAGVIQSMVAGFFERTETGAPLPYFGFPID